MKFGTSFEKWSKKIIEIKKLGFDIEISNLLERNASKEQKAKVMILQIIFYKKMTNN